MMSLLGCSPGELGGVLKALGFRVERRPLKKVPVVPGAEEPTQPAATEPAPPVAEAASEAPAVEAAATAPAPESADKVAASEPEFEEIWRPRRHPRGERRKDAPQRAKPRPEQKDRKPAAQQSPPTQAAEPTPAVAPAGGNGQEARQSAHREPRRDRGKDAPERTRDAHPRRFNSQDRRPRREERRKTEVHSAAPPRRPGGDADSPFAALGALRDELAKRAKESST